MDAYPQPPDQEPEQTREQYATELVRYVMQTDAYGRMTDEQIELADYAVGILLSRQARPDEQIHPRYFEVLNTCRRSITYTRNARKIDADRAQLARDLIAQATPTAGGYRPGGGGEHQPLKPTPPRQPSPAAHATPRAVDF